MPYQVLHHTQYLEVRFDGVIEAPLDLTQPPFSEAPGRRLLVDYGGVTEVLADAYAFAEQARQAESTGLKVAIYAPRPLLFGLSRQALQLGGVREGVSAGVFTSRDEATAWLEAG